MNPGPLAPEAKIIPLDHLANDGSCALFGSIKYVTTFVSLIESSLLNLPVVLKFPFVRGLEYRNTDEICISYFEANHTINCQEINEQ